jgi:hypothetical protein
MLNLLKTLPPVYTYRTQKKAKISDFQEESKISDFHGGRLKGKVPTRSLVPTLLTSSLFGSCHNLVPKRPESVAESQLLGCPAPYMVSLRAGLCAMPLSPIDYARRLSLHGLAVYAVADCVLIDVRLRGS